MSNQTTLPLEGIFDRDNGLLVGLKPPGPTGSLSLSGIGGSAQLLEVSSDFTLNSSNNDTVYIVRASIVVTVPTMTPNIQVTFIPTTGASVTLHPIGGVVIDGSTSDQVRSVISDPIGFSMVPSYGTANVYGTTMGINSFGNLAGAYTDNTGLAAVIDAKADASALQANSPMNGSQKMINNFVATASDIGKLFWANGATSRNLTIPAGLPHNWWCKIAKFGNAGGNITVVAGSGVTLWSKGGGLRLTGDNVSAVIRSLDDPDNNPDKYYIDGENMVV